jgi:hypothetical protein
MGSRWKGTKAQVGRLENWRVDDESEARCARRAQSGSSSEALRVTIANYGFVRAGGGRNTGV